MSVSEKNNNNKSVSVLAFQSLLNKTSNLKMIKVVLYLSRWRMTITFSLFNTEGAHKISNGVQKYKEAPFLSCVTMTNLEEDIRFLFLSFFCFALCCFVLFVCFFTAVRTMKNKNKIKNRILVKVCACYKNKLKPQEKSFVHSPYLPLVILAYGETLQKLISFVFNHQYSRPS